MALTAKKVYAILKRQISNMEAKIKTPIIYRGTVATADLLPLNPDIGDMYNIESKSIYGEAGMNVAWNGVNWDTMGAPIDMSLYIKSSELADWVKQQNKPTYTAEEVGALPADTKIPSKTSDLQNDSGFLTKIPDNYLSGTDKTLSVSGKAADAKATGDKITELSTDISNKLNKNQGSENSGKIAGINESGDIVPMFPVSVDYNEETNCLEFGSDQKMELNKGINLDSTLTKTGYAADAGAVGEITNSLKEDLDDAIGKPLKVEANKNANLIVTSLTNVYLLNFDNVIKSADSVKIRATTNDKNSGSPLKIYITEKTDTNKCIVLKIIDRNFIDTSFEEVVEISNYSNVVIGLAGAILYTDKTDKPGASALPKMVGETLNVYLSEDFNIAYNTSVFAQFDLEQMNRDAKNNKNVVTVSHDGSKMFKSIMEAVTYAKTIASKTNPITIIVYPGIYNEKIIIHNSYISIIGTNKQYCIIMNDKGDYGNAPIFASGNFYISNLTIKATHDGTPNFVENTTNDYRIGAYGIHIDNSDYANTDEKIGTVENCIIYSAQNQAVGIGMAKNCKYIIRNCELINDTPDRMYELYNRTLKTGALGCHRGYFDSSNYYQILEVSNCILKVNKGVSIQLGPFTKEGTGMEEHFYNNMLWSGTLGKSDSAIGTYTESPYTSYELSEDCYGNNVSALNK